MWSELARIALLGLERSPLSEATKAALAEQQIEVIENDETTILLEASALFQQFRKLPTISPISMDLPSPYKPSPIQQKYLKQESKEHFERIIAQYPKCLNEFSRLAQEKEYFLPPELLPTAFEFVRSNLQYWNAIASMLDDKAWWLIGRHPNWAALKDKPFRAIVPTNRKTQNANQFVQDFFGSNKYQSNYYDNYTRKKLLESAFYLSISFFTQKINVGNTRDHNWNHELQHFFQLLDFRREMQAALQA